MKNKHSKQKPTVENEVSSSPSPSFLKASFGAIILFVVSFLVYANTLGHQYTQDDAIVLYDNMYTQQGISGIPGILTKDTFFGFFKKEGKSHLVAGGRYRPMSLISFAIVYEFLGKAPMVSHFFNVLFYALLSVMIYKTLRLMLQEKLPDWLVILATLLYAVHPVHTEVVANIKGRDEIFSMIGAVMALYYAFKYYDTAALKYGVLAGLMMFFGLMSKENSITFLAIIPLALMAFRGVALQKTLRYTIPVFAATVVFLAIRTAVLGLDFGDTPQELMNNPYLKIVNNAYVPFTFGEKMATIMFTLGKYVQLLFAPVVLTHDYYPRQIAKMTFSSPLAFGSILLYAFLIFVAFKTWATNKMLSFSIAFYLITLSIVSNIVFPIGTNMSERFLFMPSLGFALGLAALLYHYFKDKEVVIKSILGIFIVLFSLKTFDRNKVWVNDFTLFNTDVETSPNSAKVQQAAGGSLTHEAEKETDPEKKKQMLEKAVVHLNKALEIHPTYKSAAFILGNAYFYQRQYQEAIKAYQRCLELDPEDSNARQNIGLAYFRLGRRLGEKKQEYDEAEQNLIQANNYKPNDVEIVHLLGVVNGVQGRTDKALEYFNKALAINPNHALTLLNLSKTYGIMGDKAKAEMYYKKAKEIDPNVDAGK